MKTFTLAIAALAAFPLAAAADVTKEDVKKLVGAGISEDVILAYIRSSGPVRKMSPDDLVELKQAGASDKVLAAVAGGSAPAPAPQPVAQNKVYVPTTTTVIYDTPTYYSTSSAVYCYSHGCYDSCRGYSPYYTYNTWYPRYYYSYPSYRVSVGRSGYRRFGWSMGGCW